MHKQLNLWIIAASAPLACNRELNSWPLHPESEMAIDTCIYSSRFSIVYRYLGEEAPLPEREFIKRQVTEEIDKVVTRGCLPPLESVDNCNFFVDDDGWKVEITGTISLTGEIAPDSILYHLATSRAIGETLQTLFYPVKFGCLHPS